LGRHYSNQRIKQAIKRNEFAEALEKINDYVRGHLEQVIVVGALVVLVGALVPYWMHSRADREAKAGNLLAEAQHVFSSPAADEGGSTYGGGYATAQEKYSQASSRFREITSGYGGTQAALAALVGAAQCDLRLGKPDQAAQAFKAFADAHASHPLAPVAAAGAAYCLESQGKLAEAAAAFSAAAAKWPAAANLGDLLLGSARDFGAAGDAAHQQEALAKLVALSGHAPKEQVERAQAELKALKHGKG